MIEYIKKDVTTVDVGIVAHGVNCQHAMGSGVAKAIREKWPQVYEGYMSSPKGKSMLGTAWLVNLNDKLYIANCYTQEFYGREGKFATVDAIRESLRTVANWANVLNLPVYMPRIGCGLGGLSWEADVEPIVQEIGNTYKEVDIYVCDW